MTCQIKKDHKTMAFQTKSDHIVWSRNYTINEFLAAYGKQMPQIVKVTQGFHGDYLVDSISTNEILRVEKYSQQKRVIGQDMYGQPLSLPVNFDKLLQLVADDGKLSTASPPCTLKTLLNSIPLPFKARLLNVTHTSQERQDLGVFRLDSPFQQPHLLVNCILVDQLEPRVRMIPSSLVDVRLAVGKGFDDKSMNWKGFLSELDHVASTLDYNGISGSSVIALYAAETPGGDEIPHDNLVPKRLSVQNDNTAQTGVSRPIKAFKDTVVYVVPVLPTSVNVRTPGFPAESSVAGKKPPYVKNEQPPSAALHQPPSIERKRPPPVGCKQPPPVPLQQPPSIGRKQPPPVAEKPKVVVRPTAPDDKEMPTSPADRIVSWHQVPRDLWSLSCKQICQCLELLNLDQSTINIFREKQLNGALLKLLSEENLREFLAKDTGLALIDREKTINFIKYKWRPT